MKYVFYAYGHENMLATHEKTIEFTKDDFLTKKGDCIIGIRADFNPEKIKKFLKFKKLKITLSSGREKDEFFFEANPSFNSIHELVMRKTRFISDRTFGIGADRSAAELSRKLFDKLKSPERKIKAVIESCD
ncbi:MAG TPA: DUF371 domain-containing protein [Candidatus Nanoarchaeia archaeon]|nr:DUF371 domain-containing protein [Candidatus Nanoarchaeia archaeon]